MKPNYLFQLVACIFLFVSMGCNNPSNPPADGFNANESDPKAIEIADEVMQAFGGRKNWDATHYIAWNFFGSRKLIWNKYTGDVRIESLKNDTKILVNIHTMKGKVYKDGAELVQPDSLAKYLEDGRKYWINDSYWLVMPFKLKDSGVTLKFLGEEDTQKGSKADVIRLTFKGVGVTPDNSYKVWVNKENHLVDQWAYYKETTQPEPTFITPWEDYRTFGKIKLSLSRGERKFTDVYVFDKLPETVFSSFAQVDLTKL